MLSRVPHQRTNNLFEGFTVVELLIVIIVIAILAAVTTVAFRGVQQRATVSALDSAITNTTKRLQLDKTTRGTFADSLADLQNTTETNNSGIDYQYTKNGETYCLTVTLRDTARYTCSNDVAFSDGAWSGHNAPGPVTDPVVYTQTAKFNYNQTSANSGVDFPITINYSVQPTDYVFILFNTHYYTGMTLKNGATNIPRIYSMSMGTSGYNWHQAFGVSGLSGNATISANACWTPQCTYNNVAVTGGYVVYVIRGLGASPTMTATNTPYGVQPGSGVSVSPASQSVNARKVAIYSYTFYGNNLPTVSDISSPGLTWTADASAPPLNNGTDIAAWHSFSPVSTSVQYRATMAASGTSYFGSVLFTIK